MSAKIISMINYKGGVGKTVSTYNIGFGLAFFNDAKVLLVDLVQRFVINRTLFLSESSAASLLFLDVATATPAKKRLAYE